MLFLISMLLLYVPEMVRCCDEGELACACNGAMLQRSLSAVGLCQQ